MHSTTRHLRGTVKTTRRRAHRDAERATELRTASTAQAITLYVVGILVETLGIALIAAYGWIFAGAAIAVVGLSMAITGNRQWPAPQHSVSIVAGTANYLAVRRRSR
jgi:hypothetical protein